MSHASRTFNQLLTFALTVAALVVFGAPASAQENSGYVEDWSSHHLVFSNPGSEREALDRGTYDTWLKITGDQRYIMQENRRHQPQWRIRYDRSRFKRDWSMKVGAASTGTLTLTVTCPTNCNGNVSSSSTVTVDGQTFTASPPIAEIGTLTVSAAPAVTASLVVGVVTYKFCTGPACASTTESANTCTIYEGLIIGSTATTYSDLLGAISNGAAGNAKGTGAWECGTITGNTASYTSNNGSSTITMTAVTAGSVGYTVTVPTGITFSDTGTGDTAGSDGTNSATTFKYTTNSAYDTQAQLAADLDTAFGDNATVTGAITVSYTAGSNTITLTNKTSSSYTISDASFTALSGTGTLAGTQLQPTVQPNTYPAKYGFSLTDTNTPSCSDYIVYPTGFAGASGSAGQATVVGYNNLYKTTCSGSVPSIAWAYNTGTGATAGLSPTLSADGTQVAYIQVSSSVASLVLLKWAAAGGTATSAGLSANETGTCTLNSTTSVTGCPSGFFTQATVGSAISGTGIPAGAYISAYVSGTAATLSQAATVSASQSLTVYAPTSTTPITLTAQTTAANYQSCTAPCFYAITLNGSPNDTNSAPFYTYKSTVSDTIFVGDNSGKMHKFNPVFNGTPAEITTNWPATVSTQTNKTLTNAVYDGGTSQLVYVTDNSGYLYSISSGATPGTAGKSSQMECGAYGFVDGPVVDSSAEQVYVFVGDGCSDGTSPNFSSYVNRFAAGTVSSYGANNAQFGNQTTNDTNTVQYDGAFDNTYYSGSGNTGNLYACVNGAVFQIPMSSFSTTTQVALNNSTFSTLYSTAASDAAACSPVTEYYNTSGSGADYLFVSLDANGKTVGGITCTGGCIYNFNITAAGTTGNPSDALGAAGGTGGIVVDNSGALTGESQVYYTSLANQTCVGNGTTGNGTGNCAVQASQSALQ